MITLAVKGCLVIKMSNKTTRQVETLKIIFQSLRFFDHLPQICLKNLNLNFFFYEKKSCNLQVVSKALEAGLLCVGISNMTQFGLNGIGFNNSVKHGTCRNPIE